MNPTEAVFISSYARGIMGDVILMAVTTIFYGFYILVFLFATVVLCRRKWSTATFIMFTLTVVVFLLNTADCIGQVYILVDLIKAGFVDLPGSDLIRQFKKAHAHMQWMLVLDNWPITVNMSVNDAILVWRVCCLFPGHIWVRIPVCCLGLANSVLALIFSICGSVEFLRGEGGESLSGPERLGMLPTAWIAVSIFTNVVCIGLVSRIAWKNRATLLRSKQTSPVQKILSLLVESGVVFVLLQITLVITQSIERPPFCPQDVAFASLIRTVTISAAIVPSLVLVIVNREDSLSYRNGSLGSIDGGSFEWVVARSSFELQDASKWNAEPVAIRIDAAKTVESFATGDEV